ncbi:MAG: hypothetical protein HFH53_06680, partial [Hespellia sp.]|nr:hypothetical protein [Hespellia sp.]
MGTIRYEKNNHIGTIIIDNEKKINCMTKDMLESMKEQVIRCNNDPDVYCVIIKFLASLSYIGPCHFIIGFFMNR